MLTGLSVLGTKYYINHTQVVPTRGGSLTIAIIGSPRFLNPVLNQLNNPDRDLTPIFFSSLMKYDDQGNLISDLAQNYTINDDGKTYDIALRKDIKWQDGKPLTIDDVIFTLQTIQNPEYKSPLRTLWQGAEFEKIDDQTIRFNLQNPYAPFLHTLTFGILPKHLWENISPAQFPLNDLNLKPIGSGPYKFSKYLKDSNGKITRLETKASRNYFLGTPYISNVAFQFYNSEEEAITAYKNGEVNALGFVSQENKNKLQSENANLTIYSLKLPRYFAIFFNQSQNPALTDKNVRQALAYATDRNQLVKQVLGDEGETVDTPILAGMTGFSDQTKKYIFDPEKAKSILTAAGWKKASTVSTSTPVDSANADILQKDGKLLEITLTTNDWPELVQAAQLIQQQWLQIGIKVNLSVKDATAIQNEIIRPRQYQALLFGEVLGMEPDPFSFWHSSQAKDPGLNLSLYSNINADNLLMNARQDMDTNSRTQKYQQFSSLVAEDVPAIFLYSPNYLLAINKDFKGIEFKNINNISSYFNQINTWYISTARAWK